MFRSTRLKLTAWYLIIIVLITLFFSVSAYQLMTFEIRRGLHLQAQRTNQDAESRLNSGRDGYLSEHGSGREEEGSFEDDGDSSENREDEDHSREGEEDSHWERSPLIPILGLFAPLPPFEFDIDLYEEERHRVSLYLVMLNAGILIVSGLAAYFLAGRTLRPIEEMVDEQKRFVSDASHELRTPLAAMRTEIEVALREHGLSAKDAKDVLNSNLEEIDKLQQLSDRLLALGRLQKASNILNLEAVNVAEEGDEAIRRVLPMATAKNIDIEYDFTGVTVDAQKDSIRELLVIFLDNAIKYSRENSKIIMKVIPRNTNAEIVIKDYGVGIMAGDMPNIFNRFYRADISRSKENVHGYGLGLSIAKGIVNRLHGKISVESEPDLGTTFIITIPRKHKS